MTATVAMYLRLSDEDGSWGESNSISAQRGMIAQYIRGHPILSQWTVKEFSDDGYSGTHFQRPAMEKLLYQVKNCDIQCIVVKDLSRFGRNYIEVGTYLEQVFPLIGVRFISINDHYDSADSQTEWMGVAFKNLMSDLYSKDLSQKIITARRVAASKGKFVTAFAPYGYQKSKDHRLLPDLEAAPIVEEIFAQRDSGISMAEIARGLNQRGIPSPMTLRQMRGEQFVMGGNRTGRYVWKTSVISSMLDDQRYIGDGVYGKVKPERVGGRKSIPCPKEDWVIVPDAHPALVSRAVFYRIRSGRKGYAKKEST